MMFSSSRGALSVSRVLLLILVLMFAGFFTAFMTNSPVADAILQGAGLVDNRTDYTVEVESQEELSDLAMFVYHRASNDGCKEDGGQGPTVVKQNDGELSFSDKGWSDGSKYSDGGYPFLSGSYLSKYPECYGAEGGPTRAAGSDGVWGSITGIYGSSTQNPGDDMEGIFSREKFEIKGSDPIIIEDSSNGQGPSWLESNFLVAFRSDFESIANKDCGATMEHQGTNDQFGLFFQPEPGDQRASKWGEDNMGGEENNAYCGRALNPGSAPTISNQFGRRNNDDNARVVLCPGDKGYIQVNKWVGGKEKPTHSGEAGEGETGARKAGFIQITELGQPCGQSDSWLVKIWSDREQSGNAMTLYEGSSNLNNEPDSIARRRSVEVNGVKARLWTKTGTSGEQMNIAGPVDRLGFGNEVHSLQIEGGNSCEATLTSNGAAMNGKELTCDYDCSCENANGQTFSNACEDLTNAGVAGRDGVTWDGLADRVEVNGGSSCTVTLHSETGHSGMIAVLAEGTSYLEMGDGDLGDVLSGNPVDSVEIIE